MSLQNEVDQLVLALDADFYLTRYADVAAAGIDPVLHYCRFGWKEGRDPTPGFSTAYYLANNPDVAAAGINPFAHYLLHGKSEGRSPRPAVAGPYDTVRAAMQPVTRIASSSQDAPTGDTHYLLNRLVGGPFVVSVSHDDYAANVGGVQNVVSDEAKIVVEEFAYLHLSPAVHEMQLSEHRYSYTFSVRLNGEHLGTFESAQLESVLANQSLDKRRIWVIHHLMAHSPEVLAKLIAASNPVATLFWTHDQFSACPNFSLMRNNLVYCGVPPVGSGSCRICVYGKYRPEHVDRIWAFLDQVSPRILSPSQSALDIWRRAHGKYASRSAVQPLATLALSPTASERPKRKDKIRVGFLGARAHHKGWQVFLDLAGRYHADERYEFYQLGYPSGEPLPDYITNVPVSVTATDRNAMVEAIALYNINAVLMWSLCAETFSFSVHEAIAAGVYLIGRIDEGNQWKAIELYANETSSGFKTSHDMFDAFAKDAFFETIATSLPPKGALVSSGGGAEILLNMLKGKIS